MRSAALLLSLIAVACGPNAGQSDGDNSDIPPVGNGSEFADAAPAVPCQKMDILFVIDDSLSMAEEQDNLAANFPQFIDVIHNHTTSAGDLLDYRVAVTTTGRDVDYTLVPPPPFPEWPTSDSGPNGEMQQKCGMNKRWLARDDADVADKFSCVANVGTGGSSLEMPLYTTELALSQRMDDGTNTGFLREDALLALVILTDEDDCSRRDNGFEIPNDQCDPPQPQNFPVNDTIGFLDNLTGARGRWAASVIAGPGPGTCESSFGLAYEAKRLRQFVDLAGGNTVFSSVCDGDLSGGLAEALSTFETACEGFPPVL